MTAPSSISAFSVFGDAINFIFHRQRGADRSDAWSAAPTRSCTSRTAAQGDLPGARRRRSLIALPGRVCCSAISDGASSSPSRSGNAGRAIPELALIAFVAACIGVGLLNVTFALAILGIPPILTNTYVGVRQVDRDAVEAAPRHGDERPADDRSGWSCRWRSRRSWPASGPAAINIVATATIAPLAGISTLGDFILGRNVYGDAGVLAGAMLIAFLALALELTLAGLQWLLTPRGPEARAGECQPHRIFASITGVSRSAQTRGESRDDRPSRRGRPSR